MLGNLLAALAAGFVCGLLFWRMKDTWIGGWKLSTHLLIALMIGAGSHFLFRYMVDAWVGDSTESEDLPCPNPAASEELVKSAMDAMESGKGRFDKWHPLSEGSSTGFRVEFEELGRLYRVTWWASPFTSAESPEVRWMMYMIDIEDRQIGSDKNRYYLDFYATGCVFRGKLDDMKGNREFRLYKEYSEADLAIHAELQRNYVNILEAVVARGNE